ncbi:GldG family protein [Thiolapillus sp.]
MNLRHRLLPLLVLLVLSLALYLGQRCDHQWDWSLNGRNQLHPRSIALLKQLDAPLRITAFVPDHPVQRAGIRELLDKYRQQHPATRLQFVDPSQHPEQARKLGIHSTPQLLVEYNNRQELISRANEQLLTRAIARLSLNSKGWIASLQGHGEASLLGKRNYDLGDFGHLLQDKGYKIIDLNLADTGQIPDNVDLLVLASPSLPLSDKESGLLQHWLNQGHALLWLADGVIPDALAEYLQLDFLPGTIVDAAAADLGMDNPTVAVARSTPSSPLKDALNGPVFMPGARAIDPESPSWNAIALLKTESRSWNETGPLKGSIRRDPESGEQPGPLNLALALSRKTGSGEESRILVAGDGDFLSNSVLGNGSNQNFGLAAIHWLTANDRLVDIPPFTPTDQKLHWSPAKNALIAGLFLFALPLLLAITGLFIVWRRRRR